MSGIYESALENNISTFDLNQLLIKGSFAIGIIFLGIIFGKLLGLGLKKLSKQLELHQQIRGSFIDLFIVIIKWSVYIIFINLGLGQLEIPALTNIFTNVLIVIPAFTGALILIALGFSIAYYLKNIIKSSEVKGWKIISQIVFYFVLFVFGVYALKTALISFDEKTTNTIIIILTGVIATAIAYTTSKKELNEHQEEHK